MSSYVLDVTEDDFEAEVLRRSLQVPVVVDFWAAWCAPCHMLEPVLERAVGSRGGRVVLARVDVDANPRLAALFQVQGIPAVKAFAGGRLVDEFVGAQPATVVERFLDDLAGPATAPAAEAAGLDPAEAAARWRAALEADPGDVAARSGLARLALDAGQPAEALEWLRPVQHDPEVATVLAQARLAAEAADPSSPLAAAAARATDGQSEAALAELLAAVRAGSGEPRDRARGLMLDVFRLLGDTHPLTLRYRRDLTAALF